MSSGGEIIKKRERSRRGSGPLIATVSDLCAVISYYSLAWVLLLNIKNHG